MGLLGARAQDDVGRWQDLGVREHPQMCKVKWELSQGWERGAEEQTTQNYPWLFLGTKAGG